DYYCQSYDRSLSAHLF
nr:immunoglobulin light chain junction region [Macaca mulatta]MOW18345.1 immunoglobulin light chain junction region [Macaca mulatta]